MRVQNDNDDFHPVEFGGKAVYAATIIALIYAASMVVCTLVIAFGGNELLKQYLTFSSSDIFRNGRLWTMVTYALYNPPSLWTVWDIYILWFFGRELEKFYGRRIYLQLYLSIFILTPILFLAIGYFTPMSIAGVTGSFAIFVAFATRFPSFPMIFGIAAWHMAIVYVAVGTLMCIAGHLWSLLISLWATVLYAYFFIRYQNGDFQIPSLSLFRRKPKFRVVPKPKPTENTLMPAREVNEPTDEVDTLLDKIAKTGLASLTDAERAQLERAREALLKKDR